MALDKDICKLWLSNVRKASDNVIAEATGICVDFAYALNNHRHFKSQFLGSQLFCNPDRIEKLTNGFRLITKVKASKSDIDSYDALADDIYDFEIKTAWGLQDCLKSAFRLYQPSKISKIKSDDRIQLPNCEFKSAFVVKGIIPSAMMQLSITCYSRSEWPGMVLRNQCFMIDCKLSKFETK